MTRSCAAQERLEPVALVHSDPVHRSKNTRSRKFGHKFAFRCSSLGSNRIQPSSRERPHTWMGEGAPPQISVAVGVTVGLIASFIQSLGAPCLPCWELLTRAGLTIQRKSHLQNEALPLALRKRDFRRPLWITGFLVFICSNLCGASPFGPSSRLTLVVFSGTIFQIGALPIVVLGPLGAVSLLYNAFFAKVILGDRFSLHLIAGQSTPLRSALADVLLQAPSSSQAVQSSSAYLVVRPSRKVEWI